MRPSLFALAALLTLGITRSGLAQRTETAETFTGYILTAACAGHKDSNAKHAINEAAACSKGVQQTQTKCVLYDPEAKITYDLADQGKVAKFACEDVNVMGYVVDASRAIHVSEIALY